MTGTATKTPTITLTPTATATPTSTATNTVTPTNTATPILSFAVTSVCSSNPSATLNWSIRNPYPDSITLTWDIYGSSQAESIAAGGLTENALTTNRVDGTNTLRVFRNGSMVASLSSSLAKCPTPTPTATATNTPTITPTVTVTPTVTNTPVGTLPPKQTETPTPTITSAPADTPTPTPTPGTCSISGALREGGKVMSPTFLSRIMKAGAKVVISNLQTREKIVISINDDSYSRTVPCNAAYQVTVTDSSKVLAVGSKPNLFKFWLLDQPGKRDATGRDFGLKAVRQTGG